MVFIILLVFNLSFSNSFEEIFKNANKLYENQKYEEAVKLYESLLEKNVVSAQLYYNLGNAYYRIGKLGYAILMYEKAIRIAPRDNDIKYNLEFSRSLIKGETALPEPLSKFFISIFNFFSLNELAILLSISYYLFFFNLILNRFIFHPLLKKTILPIAILFLIFLSWFGIKFYSEKIIRTAILIEDHVECKSGPDDSYITSFIIPQGKKLTILQERNNWIEIFITPEHLKGWIKKSYVLEI
jgi:tetratricopeptide (TPR) repeat protein